MQATGTNTPFLLKAEKINQESGQHSRGEFDSGLTYTSHVKRSQGCCLETELHLDASRTSWSAQGSRHTLTSHNSATDEILAPRMVLAPRLPPPPDRGFKPEPRARLKSPRLCTDNSTSPACGVDVAGMGVCYTAHSMQLLQLAELRLNPRAGPPIYPCGPHIDHQVTVPFARTEHYLRSFLTPAYVVDYGTPWCARNDLHITTSSTP
ncbi:hypothetical protein GWK47_017243 [Chionoecetes opilio]|uniref:Uncharacterized protein n=1 Tax=Chionoecetes opilio TaxID=41210 RepID=A0A8J4XRD7_CHIOP|nr:hypothetical protein GWK47_017243 [Chionoecetes opilio]